MQGGDSKDESFKEKELKFSDATTVNNGASTNRLAYGQKIDGQLSNGAQKYAFFSAGTVAPPTFGDLPVMGRVFKDRLLAEPSQVEVSATDQPYSTFSLHVSDVSFLLAKAALARGEKPDRESIRPEEFYNAFDYGDPAPATGEKIACRIEQAAHPVLQQRTWCGSR